MGKPLGRLAPFVALGFITLFASCAEVGEIAAPDAGVASGPQLLATVPAKGTSASLDFGTWNIEWFGDPANGPTDDALQQTNVRDVIVGADLDIWGLQEVVNATRFNNLEAQLTGYTGFLANESFVVDGPTYYSGFSNNEQKVGILYKSSLATLLGARIILTANDFDFAGRPPMEVKLRVTLNGTTEDIVVVVLHMKCCTDDESYTRRQNASNALKAYLDATYPTQKVFVIGDWNDDVDASINAGRTSPYKNFVDAASNYRFPTKALSDAGVSSTSYPDLIDHQLVTNEASATYVSGSAEVYRLDTYITNYSTTTSDHHPVLTRYTMGGSPPPLNVAPTASFTYSCSGLTCTFTDGSTDSDGTIAAWSWNFGDAGTSAVQNPSRTYAAAGSYAVSLTVTDNGGATGSQSQTVTVTAPAPDNITLAARGYRSGKTPKVDLTWSGSSAANVDVFRNGVKIVTTPNDGLYTDALARGSSGTFTYRVCNASTTTCSPNASVVF